MDQRCVAGDQGTRPGVADRNCFVRTRYACAFEALSRNNRNTCAFDGFEYREFRTELRIVRRLDWNAARRTPHQCARACTTLPLRLLPFACDTHARARATACHPLGAIPGASAVLTSPTTRARQQHRCACCRARRHAPPLTVRSEHLPGVLASQSSSIGVALLPLAPAWMEALRLAFHSSICALSSGFSMSISTVQRAREKGSVSSESRWREMTARSTE